MNTEKSVQADERTLAVVHASNTWVLAFTTFALLIDVFCRSVFFHEACLGFDGLGRAPGLVAMIYQARKKSMGTELYGR